MLDIFHDYVTQLKLFIYLLSDFNLDGFASSQDS